MKRLLTVIFAFCLLPFAFAEDLFLRQGASGSANGSDWNNAWTTFAQVQWGAGAGKVSAGDTLWIAAGSYASLTPGASGTAGDPATTWIRVWRATASDSAATSAAGWSAAFDGAITNTGINMPTAHLGEYVWYSGRTATGGTNCGWVVTVSVGSSAINWPQYSVNDLIFDGIEIRGPAPHPQTTAYNFGLGNSTRGFDLTAWNGSWQQLTNIWITNNFIHGVVDCTYLVNCRWVHVDHNVICDNWTVGDVSIDSQHENVCLTLVSSDMTFRNNSISNWAVEGIEMGYTHSNWEVSGNIWKKMSAGPYARVLETQYQPTSGVLLYNNTFIDVWLVVYDDKSGGGWSGCLAKNNVYINSGGPAGGTGWTTDYNAYDTTTSEAHGLGSITTAVFQNYNGRDYRSVTNIASNRLRQKGVDLGTYVDAFGTDRDADGAWTIGFAAIVPPGQEGPPPDTTPPVLTSIAAGAIAQNTATITWNTDESATSGVKYGLTASYGSTVTNGNSYALSQSVALSGLTANTTYHYQPWSSDVAGNTASNVDLTFTTANIVINATTLTITGP